MYQLKHTQRTSETNQATTNSTSTGGNSLSQLSRSLGHKSTDIVNEYLTALEAADFLRIKVGTIYKYSHKKTIKHSKIGKKLRFKIADLIEWVNKGLRHSA